MPVVLKNVVIWTSRPKMYSSTTGTGASVPLLAKVEAHQGPVPQSDYVTLPASALESHYLFKVDIGTDIKKGDIVSQVRCNNPPQYSLWDALGANETLLVSFARDSASGPLSHRRIYCQRITAGGPSV